MPKTFQKPVNQSAEELRQIKARQRARKQAGKPAKVSNETLYEMLSDILENQARIENILKNRG